MQNEGVFCCYCSGRDDGFGENGVDFDFTALVTEHARTESKSANSSINDAYSWRQRLQLQ